LPSVFIVIFCLFVSSEPCINSLPDDVVNDVNVISALFNTDSFAVCNNTVDILDANDICCGILFVMRDCKLSI
jgi:hypothetical protein